MSVHAPGSQYIEIETLEGARIEIERRKGLFYIDCMGVMEIQVKMHNGKHAVMLKTCERDVYISGSEYWKLLHQEINKHISKNEIGVLVARLHQITHFPFTLLGDSTLEDWLGNCK